MRISFPAIVIILTFGAAFGLSQGAPGDRSAVRVLPLSSQVDRSTSLIEGNVVLVYDGDTFSVVAKDGSMYIVRIDGIDAPENRQAYGPESTRNLAALIQGMDVVVIPRKADIRERQIGAVYIDGEDVGLVQLRRGMAWNEPVFNSERSGDQREIYSRAEAKARVERTGLWASQNPIAPWEFRGERPTSPIIEPGGDDKPAAAAQRSESNETKSAPTDRKYIIGPRGGCYYLNDSGVKVYVRDKTHCIKQ